MTFLECINRILRMNAVIRGDTDTVATFNDIAHNATLNVGIICVQNELVKLIADRLIPKERLTSGSISLVNGTRVYNLAAAFTRFYGVPHLYNATDNRQIYEYNGGLETLQIDIWDYTTQSGDPVSWYWEPSNSATKQIGLFPVPTANEGGEAWTYDYETSVLVSDSTDDLPFHNDEENFSFTEMAGRRFKFTFEDVKNEMDVQAVLDKDTSYKSAKATLFKLMRGQNPSAFYGAIYR